MTDDAGARKTANEVKQVVADCEAIWRRIGIPSETIDEMRLELGQHLTQAISEGRSVSAVVGDDPDGFARAWGAAYWDLDSRPGPENVTPPQSPSNGIAMLYGGAVILGIIAVIAAIAEPRGATPEAWRWLWTVFAVVMAIGEMFTAGFFLLPFAIGAAAAAVLAWTGLGIVSQWLTFFAVSFAALGALRCFVHRQDESGQPAVGANRLIGASGVVTETIDPIASTGMVKVEGEAWRATSQVGQIAAGAVVRVVGITGTRLIVEPPV